MGMWQWDCWENSLELCMVSLFSRSLRSLCYVLAAKPLKEPVGVLGSVLWLLLGRVPPWSQSLGCCFGRSPLQDHCPCSVMPCCSPAGKTMYQQTGQDLQDQGDRGTPQQALKQWLRASEKVPSFLFFPRTQAFPRWDYLRSRGALPIFKGVNTSLLAPCHAERSLSPSLISPCCFHSGPARGFVLWGCCLCF